MKVTKKITVKLHETNKKLISALLINLSVVVPTSIYAATGMVVNGTTFNAPAGTSIDTGTTTGWTGIALNVTNNGQVIAAGDIFLTTGGNSANTLAISGVGSNVVFSNGSTLTTTGDTAHGVYMTNNAHVTFDRADITTLGFFSSGINLLTGSTLQLTNSRITTSGNGGQAVVAVGSGLINIENTVITTTGNYQSGGAYGLHIANGSSGNLAGSQIKTSGSSSGAIFVETTNNAATTFVINDTILETAGDASIALAASELNGVGSSTVTLNGNNQIKTENGTGVSARGVGGKIIINAGTTITTKGTGVQATLNGGQVLMQGSTITTDKAG